MLSQLEGFPSPSPRYEQYEVSDVVAATLVFIAATKDDIVGRVIYDLGCGPGRLAIGAALMGARHVIGVDIDTKALKIAMRNAHKLGVNSRIEFLAQDVETLCGKADTVLMNAPFGVQRRHADRPFLRKALEIGEVIYSLHKATEGGRLFITRFVDQHGGRITFTQRMVMALPATMSFHAKRRHTILVDLYRIEKKRG